MRHHHTGNLLSYSKLTAHHRRVISRLEYFTKSAFPVSASLICVNRCFRARIVRDRHTTTTGVLGVSID